MVLAWILLPSDALESEHHFIITSMSQVQRLIKALKPEEARTSLYRPSANRQPPQRKPPLTPKPKPTLVVQLRRVPSSFVGSIADCMDCEEKRPTDAAAAAFLRHCAGPQPELMASYG